MSSESSFKLRVLWFLNKETGCRLKDEKDSLNFFFFCGKRTNFKDMIYCVVVDFERV